MKKYVFIISLFIYIASGYANKIKDGKVPPLPGDDCISGVISSIDFTYGASSQTTSFLASCDWTAYANSSWISLANNYSQNEITITCSANSTFYSRTGVITVESLENSDEKYYITVTQDEKPCTPTSYTVSGTSGNICEGSTITVTLSGSESGVNYTLKEGGSTISTKSGTGSALTWNVTASCPDNLLFIDKSYTVEAQRVSPSCSGTMSGSVSVNVYETPNSYTLSQIGDQCNGYDLILSNSQGGMTYTLYRDGNSVNSISVHKFEGGSSLDFGLYATSGDYTVVAVNDDRTSCSSPMSGTATIEARPTSSITSPTSQVICENEPVTFSVTGTNINSYQWQEKITGHDFSDISGATSSSYTISNVSATKDGYQYRCVGDGICDTKTSDSATLTVNLNTSITSNPANEEICEGSDVSFSVSATGTSLTYQWEQYNGSTWSNISGDTSSTYSIPAASSSLSGYKYRCTVSGACGTETSSSATLTVNELTVIQTQPEGAHICEGSNTTISLTATGTNLTYQWQKYDGLWVDIEGETSSSLVLTNLDASMSGDKYWCQVSGACGDELLSDAAILTLKSLAQITTQPSGGVYVEESDVSLTVSATGSATLSYQWQKDGIDITGETNPELQLLSVTESDEGVYACIVTNECNSAVSDEAYIQIDPKQLIGSWTFNDGTADDVSGNDNHGTVNGATLTTGRFGNENSAFSFDGVNDYIQIGNLPEYDLNTNDFSITAWVYMEELPNEWMSIVSKGGSGMEGYGVEISSSNLVTGSIQGVSGSNQHCTSSIIELGKWNHIVTTYNRDESISIYINNYLVHSCSINAGNESSIDNGSALLIGAYSPTGWNFDGKIDDVNIYNYTLSETEIQELYNEEDPKQLVGSWSFNDGTTKDESGNENNGTINGATLTTDRFNNDNSAYNFDGTDDFIYLNGDIDEVRTIVFWFNSSTGITSASVNTESLITRNGSSSQPGEDEFNLKFNQSTWPYPGELTFSNGQGYHILNSGINNWAANTWYFCAITIDNSEGTKMYINGSEVSSHPETTPINNIDALTAIGRWGDLDIRYFSGIIDDIKIYNYALFETEIQDLYTAPNPKLPAANLNPSESCNYIHISVPTEGYTELPTNGNYKSMEEIRYFDGIGRPTQNIQVGASPGAKDIIQHIDYDSLGREIKRFLPYTSDLAGGSFRVDAETELINFYDEALNPKSSTKITTDVNPWADVVFEESPLNRVLEQGAPGIAYQAKGEEADNAVHFAYETNTGSEVKLFDVDINNNLVVNGEYQATKLFKTGTRDENEVWSYEYKDMKGKVVLKVSEPTGLNLQTYYVYDDYGLLRYVIPPKAVEIIGSQTSGTVSANVIDNLCYYYEYDGRKRMAKKKLPGADTVYMVYDNRDRLVLTQDGNMRAEDKWMFTKYDAVNRPVLTGIYTHGSSISQDSMQTIVNAQMANFYEEIEGIYSSADFGYTNQSFPTTGMEILTVTYYDNYDFDTGRAIRDYCESIDDSDYVVSDINYAVKGQVTGTLTKVLGTTSHYLLSVNLYDDEYRVLRTYAENYLGGDDLLLTKYDFVGTVLKTKQVHVKSPGATAVTLNQRMVYDHMLRLLVVYHEIEENTDGEILMAEMNYNELGQLISKKLHEGLQDVNFEYNIRGWLTKINDPENISDDLFAMQLAYNDGISGLTTTPQFNGNISAIKWVNSQEVINHAYAFGYDQANRLASGNYYKGTTATNEFSLSKVSYDKNGNIDTLIRYGVSGLIDDLTYTYTDASSNYTNQLQQVDDASGSTEGFTDVSGLDYNYDNNGNLTEDYNKGIVSISYNYLNLPEEIDFGNGNKISYIYDAAGVKHAKFIDGTETGGRYYIGNMEYNQTQTLEFIHTNEGRVRYNGIDYAYDYYLKDHLGNTRVVFTEDVNNPGTTSTEQVTNYYPFGMRFNQTNAINGQTTRYMYNGKEIQEDYNLDWYDYGARMYDAALARWHTVDPWAEKFYSWSPYNYAYNNPMRFTDPDGRGPEDKTLTDRALKQLGINEGYKIYTNKETGASYITKTTTQIHSGATTENVSFTVTSTTFEVDGEGNVNNVSQNLTTYSAESDAEGNVSVGDGENSNFDNSKKGSFLNVYADNPEDAQKYVDRDPVVKAFANVVANQPEKAKNGELPYSQSTAIDKITKTVNFVIGAVEGYVMPHPNSGPVFPRLKNPYNYQEYYVPLKDANNAAKQYSKAATSERFKPNT